MTIQPEPGDTVLTEKAWNRLRHDGRLVRDQVTGDLPPMGALTRLAAVPADADGPLGLLAVQRRYREQG